MSDSTNKKTEQKRITKNLKYSVIVKFVNFKRKKVDTRIIIVDGVLAIRIGDRVYTKI
jgi:hypothetical protein